MKIKNKLLLIFTIINTITLMLFIAVSSSFIQKSSDYVKLENFEKAINSSIDLLSRFENELKQNEIDIYKKNLNNLVSEYNQKELLYEETIKKMITKLFVFFLIYLFFSLVILYFSVAKIIKPLKVLTELMIDYSSNPSKEKILSTSFNINTKEITTLYKTYYELIENIKEYETQLKKEEKISGWLEMSKAIVHELNNFMMPLENNILRIDKKNIADNYNIKKGINISEEFNSDIEELKRSFKNTKNVISNLRAFYRSGTKKNIEDTDIVNELKFISNGFNLSFVNNIKHYNDNLPIICKIDRLELSHVIINFVKNAMDSIKTSNIDVSNFENKIFIILSQNSDGNIKISVVDKGNGISEENIKNIFNPGFSTKKNGFGLGLSLVNKICISNNWKLNVLSKENEGTEISILI